MQQVLTRKISSNKKKNYWEKSVDKKNSKKHLRKSSKKFKTEHQVKISFMRKKCNNMKNKLILWNKEFVIDRPGTRNRLKILSNKEIKITNLSVKFIKGRKMDHLPKLKSKNQKSIWPKVDLLTKKMPIKCCKTKLSNWWKKKMKFKTSFPNKETKPTNKNKCMKENSKNTKKS